MMCACFELENIPPSFRRQFASRLAGQQFSLDNRSVRISEVTWHSIQKFLFSIILEFDQVSELKQINIYKLKGGKQILSPTLKQNTRALYQPNQSRGEIKSHAKSINRWLAISESIVDITEKSVLKYSL